MITKDRYSKAFITMASSAIVSAYLFRNSKGNYAGISFIPFVLAGAYLTYLFRQSAKLHLTNEQKNNLIIEYKGETDCGFRPIAVDKIDGIRINGKRYKFVNGSDMFLDEYEPMACGFGSFIMQTLGGGGLEPKSIQNDKCWL
ncbi:MAG: hypothetical protein ACKOX3_01735 [Bacteroidota bacterium]